ncbi:MAG: YkgJ family cysteine cluster protein [Desulfarculaceae bacterium]|nr:YkgJ family cysteine cluster protein [Desulfarculaceae bacterium]MCF8102126.1 YkgJ family cysteine cluster protein [Desulfarculaceae bacterium]
MSDERPKLQLDDDFVFACHKGLKCYTSCCRDVNIMLTPHDVLRMKKALGLTSSEFLEKYTDLVQLKGKAVPLVQFRMDEANDKKCFFVGPGGCSVYEHRPWACRMFPLDEHAHGGFQVAVTPQRCHGLAEGDDWHVRDWLKDQGATASKEMDGSYESLVSHEWINQLGELDNPKVQQMILLALYDLDRFRDFVLNSSFLDRFDLDEDTIFAAKTDDVALLDLGYAWVRFGLFGQKTLQLKEQPQAEGGE